MTRHPKLRTFEDIAQHYVAHYREREGRELRWFEIQPSLRDAIEVAGLATSPSGKRLAHQRRIPGEVLRQWADTLHERATHLQNAGSFDGLFKEIEKVGRQLHGIGELTIYDTALRIGAFLKLAPDRVYLHAGTRQGARALGIGAGTTHIARSALPAGLRRLPAAEIEDCLCLYAQDIARIRGGQATTKRMPVFVAGRQPRGCA
jgi:hypothetical protein